MQLSRHEKLRTFFQQLCPHAHKMFVLLAEQLSFLELLMPTVCLFELSIPGIIDKDVNNIMQIKTLEGMDDNCDVD